MVSLRNARHDALRVAEQAKKDRAITEDDLSFVKKQLDELMAKTKAEVDTAAKAKESEIMTV
jgi:ribosome recycling factor